MIFHILIHNSTRDPPPCWLHTPIRRFLWLPYLDDAPLLAGKTFLAFPAHAQPVILRIWQEAHESCVVAVPSTSQWCRIIPIALTWRRHQMETFSDLLAFRAGNSPVAGRWWISLTKTSDVFFDLSKQSRRRWFETPSRSLWRFCNETQPSFARQHFQDTFCHRHDNAMFLHARRVTTFLHGPLYQTRKIAGCACTVNVFLATNFKGNR